MKKYIKQAAAKQKAPMSNTILVQQILNELGLILNRWVSLDTIDNSSCKYLINNHEIPQALPKKIVGNLLIMLESDVALTRRKAILAFARRLCATIESSILRKRTQVRENKKTISKYSYRWISA